ncbi:olfactory receptor 10G2-like [Molossus molossus]|uniref:Olfactory receptor family 10 subfamily G member 2 n=1 Tax=Molossus molossus TaxID=27622 RepID=A0A7J8JYZ2_MOLMO|nr:olfactory receptor 10G2-like [Molossus molossus]KAF6501731.1 olfactory receptor family 10 subfamily G member 2 [Molossus molossus]
MGNTKNTSLDTVVTDFILLGLSHPPNLRTLLFLVFFSIYILTQLGNLLILLTVWADPKLHARPMYILLGVLSFLDMWLSSVIVPRLILNFTPANKAIPFGGCVAQLYFFHFLGSTQCFLYTLMAYDRYLAICRPLRYPMLMNGKLCTILVTGTWVAGSIHGCIQATLTFQLPYCGPNLVDYFFCDIPAILRLACADTAVNELVTFVDIGVVAASCFLLILLSYANIVHAILKIRTSGGRRQAFSTCGSHLTVVTIYYVPCIFIYLRPGSKSPLDGAVAVFYTVVTPLLNPLTYTLRNQEVKSALKRITSGGAASVNKRL